MRLVLAGLLIAGVLVACSDDGDLDAFCADVARLSDQQTAFPDLDERDPEKAAEQFATAAERYTDLRKNAPEAVRDELDVLIDLTSDLRDGFEQADPADPTSGFSVAASFEDRFPDADRASSALATFNSSQCGRNG